MQKSVNPKPNVSRMPILAVPACGEKARLPKLAVVVKALNKTARAVLVVSSGPSLAARNL